MISIFEIMNLSPQTKNHLMLGGGIAAGAGGLYALTKGDKHQQISGVSKPFVGPPKPDLSQQNNEPLDLSQHNNDPITV